MGHKCFISFKTVDAEYKRIIQEDLDIDMVDKSLNEPINSENEDYIMRKIRQDYLSTSTVTIHLVGNNSSENALFHNQNYIKRELQASLFNGENNTKNGILGVVLPEMYDDIYGGDYECSTCNAKHHYVNVNDNTVVKELSYNYYIPKETGCAWTEDERYCVLVKWSDFEKDPEKYIDQAYDKRSAPISNKTKVKP